MKSSIEAFRPDQKLFNSFIHRQYMRAATLLKEKTRKDEKMTLPANPNPAGKSKRIIRALFFLLLPVGEH